MVPVYSGFVGDRYWIICLFRVGKFIDSNLELLPRYYFKKLTYRLKWLLSSGEAQAENLVRSFAYNLHIRLCLWRGLDL
jgi:hypothetical protein